MRPAPVVELDAPDHDPETGDRPRHPNDPRVTFPHHRERGPRRYPARKPGWTVPMIAAAAGVTEHAVRRAAERGQLDLESLRSVADWTVQTATRAAQGRARRAAKTTR